jgi:hypothetical protein
VGDFKFKKLSKNVGLSALMVFIIVLGALIYCTFFSIAYNLQWLFSRYRYLRKFAIAQAKFETGNYTSSLWERANNAFGMRVPEKRRYSRVGVSNNYSVYSSAGQSLYDLFLYYDAVRINDVRPATIEEYAAFLKSKGYFTTSLQQYTEGLKTYMK